MKKSILFLFLLAMSGTLFAQKHIKVDTSIGGAFTFGDLTSYGISAAAEPKFFITPQISAGLRLEGAVLFGGTVTADGDDLSIGISSRAAQLVKGEYYFSENSTRPFVGVMLGRYVQANIGASGQGEASITASSNFGFAPEFGVTFNNFRLSAIYHVVPGTDLVSVQSGTPPEVPRNYFVFTLGFQAWRLDVE